MLGRVAILLALASVLVPGANASTLFLSVVGITGENPTPGYVNAMAVQSFTVSIADQFSAVKLVDSASPQIQTALVAGTPLANSTFLLYDGAPGVTPDAMLSFGTTFVSSQSLIIPTEQDTFAAITYGSMYLYLPGITGESSTPGYPDVMQISSFTIDPNEFWVVKDVDAASPQIALALVTGTPFSTASLLLYSSAIPAGAPDAIITFDPLLIASAQFLGGGGLVPQEQVGIVYQHIVPQQPAPVPEPASLVLCAAGLAGLVRRRA